MTGIIARIIDALAEGHSQERLQAEKDGLITSLWISLPTTPKGMERRLQKLILTGQTLKPMDLDDFIDALRPVATNPILQADLAALELVAARLGSELMAMRIGRKVVEELRGQTAAPKSRLP